MRVSRVAKLWMAVAVAAVVAACGGGSSAGGNAGGGSEPTGQPAPSNLSLEDLNDFSTGGRGFVFLRLDRIPTAFATQVVDLQAYKEFALIEAVDLEIVRELATSAAGGTADINLGVGELQPLNLVKASDESSPYLLTHAVRGSAIANGTVAFVAYQLGSGDAGREKPIEFYRIDLDRVYVTAFKQQFDNEGHGTDTFSLWYNKIAMTAWLYDAKGSLTGQNVFTWDRVANKPWTGFVPHTGKDVLLFPGL